ncbi:SDR family oxidoreductase [Vandammella animalimorsus]|uniref:SDR family NAD(P)-dependent oxidoreductase n=1 Tax=Vandammella animalimorsus TaxID=2029117 RepID=UPI0031BA2B84
METRTALVTGAAGGIGQAVCRALAQQELRIVLADCQEVVALQALADTLPGQRHAVVQVDIGELESIERMYARLQSQGIGLSVLVNVAAISPVGDGGARIDVKATSPQLWNRVFAVNAFGTYAMCRGFLMQLPPDIAHGRIVNFASTAAQLGGYQSCAAYVASKAAVIAFTKALAREVAPQGITANVVSPGLIDTPMLRARLRPDDERAALGLVPLERIGLPEEVAAAVSYLIRPEASYVTGSTLDVNGGYYMA